jgi:RNase P subunit RPR2
MNCQKCNSKLIPTIKDTTVLLSDCTIHRFVKCENCNVVNIAKYSSPIVIASYEDIIKDKEF